MLSLTALSVATPVATSPVGGGPLQSPLASQFENLDRALEQLMGSPRQSHEVVSFTVALRIHTRGGTHIYGNKSFGAVVVKKGPGHMAQNCEKDLQHLLRVSGAAPNAKS